MADREVRSEVAGAVFKIVTDVGQRLSPGDTVMLIESMKMEIPVIAEEGGTIAKFLVEETALVREGQAVALLSSAEAS